MDGYVTRSQFATIYGCGKPYVTALIKGRKLVLSEDGTLVNVEASLRLLKVDEDPSRASTRERWAAHRAAKKAAPAAPSPSPAAPPPAAPPPAADAAPQPEPGSYTAERTRRERIQADLAQLELDQQLGRLLDAESTLRGIADLMTAARTEILAMPDRLTPLVAPETDMRTVYGLIEAEAERTCRLIADRLQALRARVAA